MMDQVNILQIERDLTRLNSDFCFFLDQGQTDELVNLFTKDAHYSYSNRRSAGRVEIRELFKQRDQTIRTVRHLQNGLRLEIIDQTQAAGVSVCTTFAADALPPIEPAEPYLVAGFIDSYQLCEDGLWRISKRHIERIFTARGNLKPQGEEK